jgi:PTH1 family peptidyl-tRNA hydrolase
MLEKFLAREQLGKLKYDAKFAAEVLLVNEGIFSTPQTFMNLSGNAVESIARFYKIKPEDILVLHDEIELPLGKIALKI